MFAADLWTRRPKWPPYKISGYKPVFSEARFARIFARMSRNSKSIILIGMMGAGKSSVGRCLQRRTGLARFDTDEAVVARFGLPIAEIFSQHGEDRFRETETQVLIELAPERAAIIITGGGIVLRQENVSLLKRLGTVLWLDAEEETLFGRATRRAERPLLNTENPRAMFSKILHERGPLYAKAADVRIDTTEATHDEVADLILQEIETGTAAKR
jgi:shikimate kinase